MTQQMFRMIVFLLGMLLVTGCEDASVDAGADKTVQVNAIPNQLPIAVISNIDLNLMREEFENIGVQLDATQSTDADGRIIKYEWFVDGRLFSRVSKSRSYGLASNISSSEAEGTEHSLSLKVTDDKGATDTKTVHFTILQPSVGFLVKPDLSNRGYGIENVLIDTNTLPENNVSIVVTSSKPSMLNGSTTKSIVFTPQKYKNISLYYSAPMNVSENYIIHFDVSHSDDINYEGIQLEDISLTYNPEVLRVNPPKGSKEFISGVKGTLEFIAYIDDMTANVLDERNVFYKGLISELKFEFLESPEGMMIEGKKIYWTPTAEQSAQNYQVRVKVYDDNVEKIVAFEVHVAADKYLHTEVQDGKLVVVDPNSKLDGLMVEPLDGSDPGLMKIKIALDSQLPQKDLDATYKIRLADAFMIENKPKEYVIHIKNMQSFLDRFGASKMALRYYLIEGEDEHFGGTSWEISEIKNSKTEVFRQYLERTKRPYFYFFTIPKYLSLLEEDSIVTKKSLALDTQMPVMEKSSTTLCQVHRVPTEWDDYPDTYEFICPLNANTTLTIVDEQALSPDYTIWDGVTRYCTSMATRGTTQCIIIGYGYS